MGGEGVVFLKQQAVLGFSHLLHPITITFFLFRLLSAGQSLCNGFQNLLTCCSLTEVRYASARTSLTPSKPLVLTLALHAFNFLYVIFSLCFLVYHLLLTSLLSEF